MRRIRLEAFLPLCLVVALLGLAAVPVLAGIMFPTGPARSESYVGGHSPIPPPSVWRLKAAALRGQRPVRHAAISEMYLSLPRGWRVSGPGTAQAAHQRLRLTLALPRGAGTGATVVITCYAGRLSRPTMRDLFGGPGTFADYVGGFYGDVPAFLARFRTPLDLFLAAADARPGMLRGAWGRSRWEADALLSLRTGLCGRVTGLLVTSRLYAIVKGTRRMFEPTVAPEISSERQRRGLWTCRLGLNLFDKNGDLRLWDVQVRITAASRALALRALIDILSWASLEPGVPVRESAANEVRNDR